MTGRTRTIGQRRAAHALEKMRDIPEELRKDYSRYVTRLGPAIVTNGLGQAVATELAASKGRQDNAHKLLADNLADWLCGNTPDAVYQGAEALLPAIVEGDEHTYMRAQAEALAWLEWHKKLCRAEFGTAESRDDDG